MAPPAAKKQKKSNKPAIIFTVPGCRADVRMFVFDKEFQVYSGVLKTYSRFFEKFFEPSGDEMLHSTSTFLKSDWLTYVETASTWYLTSDHKLAGTAASTFSAPKGPQEKAFQDLLCAMFSRPYKIQNTSQLEIVTRIASYYCALPILSYTIFGSFFGNSELIKSLQSEPCSALSSACKLRNSVLFREALIYTLAPWLEPRYLQISDQALRKFAEREYDRLNQMLAVAYTTILQLSAGYVKQSICCEEQIAKDMLALSSSCIGPRGLKVPLFIRKCSEVQVSDDANGALQEIFLPLLKSDLVLNNEAVAGKGSFDDFFLACKIKDEDLPWDTTQIDL